MKSFEPILWDWVPEWRAHFVLYANTGIFWHIINAESNISDFLPFPRCRKRATFALANPLY